MKRVSKAVREDMRWRKEGPRCSNCKKVREETSTRGSGVRAYQVTKCYCDLCPNQLFATKVMAWCRYHEFKD